MTTNVQTATEDTTLEDIVRLMEQRRIKRVPVLRGKKLVGIISRANLLHALVQIAHEVRPSPPQDAVIREHLLAELKEQRWAPVGTIDVTVRDGVVTLSGVLLDERQREALQVAAQNISGVVKVEDHMVWMDRASGMFMEPPSDSSVCAIATVVQKSRRCGQAFVNRRDSQGLRSATTVPRHVMRSQSHLRQGELASMGTSFAILIISRLRNQIVQGRSRCRHNQVSVGGGCALRQLDGEKPRIDKSSMRLILVTASKV